MVFGGTAAITINMWNGNCQIITHLCKTEDLGLPLIQNNVVFIVKIYRSDKKIMIDINGENKVKLDTTNPPLCSSFWGAGEINEVYFSSAADKNAATRYRILGDDNDNDDDGADDAGGLSQINVKLIIKRKTITTCGYQRLIFKTYMIRNMNSV